MPFGQRLEHQEFLKGRKHRRKFLMTITDLVQFFLGSTAVEKELVACLLRDGQTKKPIATQMLHANVASFSGCRYSVAALRFAL